MFKTYIRNIASHLFALLVIQSVNAQFAPSSMRISTPYGPRTIPTYQHSPMMLYRGGAGNPSIKYKFTVVLINDSIVKDKGRINIYDSVHSITFKDHGEKKTYKPSDTRELFRLTPEGMKLSGIPSDTCWLFKTETGKINLYSCIAEPGTDMVTAMQTGEDAGIESLDKEKVMELVKQYPRLLKMAEKGKLVKALRGYNKE